MRGIGLLVPGRSCAGSELCGVGAVPGRGRAGSWLWCRGFETRAVRVALTGSERSGFEARAGAVRGGLRRRGRPRGGGGVS